METRDALTSQQTVSPMTEGLSHQICQESLLKSCSLRNHGYTAGGGGADSGGGITFSVTSCRETDLMNFQFE